MLDRPLLVKIHVRNSNIAESDPVYPVIKIVDDKEVVKKFNPITVNMDERPDE
ncbi:hypothetical protein PIB30_082979, partial [Stylosanthes scabra]|nr:hypothetical protein [Stylosanthes scabra]